MKKIGLFIFSLLVSMAALGADYSVYFQQKLPGGVPGFRSIIIDEPTSNAFYLYNLANHQPEQFTFDSTIICNTTSHVCSVPTTVGPMGPNGIDGAPGAKGDTGAAGVNSWAAIPDKPTTFPPASHTTSLLTDMTSAGRAVAQAADASAIRTLLGVQSASDAAAAFYPLAGNPSAFVNQAGARSAITLDTSGTGAATYTSSTGVLKIPTPAAATVINRAIVTTAADGTYTWTFPTACSGTAVVQVTPQNSTSGEVINHKVTAVSSTGMTVATSRAVLTLNALLGLTIPIIQTNSAQTLHLIAVCP